MVKTSQITTKCKTGCRIIALEQQKSKYSIIITKHMRCRWVLHLNLVIDRFKCYSTHDVWCFGKTEELDISLSDFRAVHWIDPTTCEFDRTQVCLYCIHFQM